MRKFPFIKPNFRKVIVTDEEIDKDDEVREIIVEKKTGFNTFEVLVLLLLAIIFGIVIGNSFSLFKNEIQGEKVSSELQELVAVYNHILDNYYKDIKEQDLVDAAVDGMLSSLDDPYSVYMDEEKSESFNESVDGSYTGVGITISAVDDNIVILDVSKNSPAEKADIRVGDILLKINGDVVTADNMSDIMGSIRNSSNDEVKVLIRRDNEEIEKTLHVEEIDLVTVTSKVYALNNGNTGYISIDSFAANTYKQFKNELAKLEKKNIHSLIIDVRSNPGGHVKQTKKILELFMKKIEVLYQVQFKKDKTKIKDNTKESRDYPVVVLIDSASASASEILASAFKESYSNSYLIGDTTYGKGTVQTAYTLSDGTSVKYTTEKWLTPKGNWIDGKGISPDKEVLLTSEYFSAPNDEHDFQLQTALDFLENTKDTSIN